jgi:hypothetical protein
LADVVPLTSRINSIAAIAIAAACFVLPPAIYGKVAYDNIVADLDGDVYATRM